MGSGWCLLCHQVINFTWWRTSHHAGFQRRGLKGSLECEVCHGDGTAHILSLGLKKMPDLKTADQEKINQVCGLCHLGPQDGPVPAPRLSRQAWTAGSHLKKGLACTSCHQIHAPEEKDRNRLCHRCHSPGEALGELTGRKAHTSGEHCTTCHRPHGEIRGSEEFTRKYVHKPVQEGKCSECHTPHQAASGKLTLGEANAICLKCHEDKVTFYLFNAHGQAAIWSGQGQCLSCHEVHSSNYRGLLVNEPYRVCRACHYNMKPHHFLLAANLSEEQLPCTDCHNPHSNEAYAYLKMDQKNLCLDCHKL